MKSKWVKFVPIPIWDLVRILLILASIIVAVLLSMRRATSEIKISLSKQTENAAIEIKDSLSKQTEHATSKIKESLTEQTEQTTSAIKHNLSKQTEQINARIQDIFSDVVPVVKLREHEVKVFPDDPSSSFTVVSIDPAEGEVAIQTNTKGELRNAALSKGRTATISIPQGGTYHLILTGIEAIGGSRIARVVISQEKGAEQ